MMNKRVAAAMAVAMTALAAGAPAGAATGGDAAACAAGNEPAILAEITGLRDRTGRLKLELYPATDADFLKDDRDLIAQNKVFRRVWAEVPPSGPVAICLKVPAPGRYALFLTHDRDGKNKFNFWADGAGVPSNHKIGMSRPKLANAVVDVGAGVTPVAIRVQYLRGLLNGFGPLKDAKAK